MFSLLLTPSVSTLCVSNGTHHFFFVAAVPPMVQDAKNVALNMTDPRAQNRWRDSSQNVSDGCQFFHTGSLNRVPVLVICIWWFRVVIISPLEWGKKLTQLDSFNSAGVGRRLRSSQGRWAQGRVPASARPIRLVSQWWVSCDPKPPFTPILFS